MRFLHIRDAYDWHQRIWQAFEGRDGQPRDFLIRVDRKEEAYRAIILSSSIPTRPQWCPSDCFATKAIPEDFFTHGHYQFSLLANPTTKIRSNKAGERTKNGRRVPVLGHDALVSWMQRKAEAGGFSFDTETLRVTPMGLEFFHKKKDNRHGSHYAHEFRGVLTVTDPTQFRATLAAGIGSAKAFGFGLLALSPIK